MTLMSSFSSDRIFLQPLDQGQDLLVLLDDLFHLERREPAQPHIEDRLGLDIGKRQKRAIRRSLASGWVLEALMMLMTSSMF